MIYIGYLSLFLFATFLDFTKEIRLKKITELIFILVSIFFVGLRYYTGSDWSGYINYFNTVTWSDQRYQLGFKALNIFGKQIINDYHFVQCIATSVFFISVVRFFSKYAKYPFICLYIFIVLYFGELLMSQVRQSLAIAILLFGSGFLFDKKYFQWCIVVFLASLFHFTALVAVAFVCLHVKLSNKMKILLCCVPIIIWVYPDVVFYFFETIAKIPGKFGELVTNYLNLEQFNKGAKLNSGLYFFSKILLSIFIIISVKPKTTNENVFLNSLLVSMLLGSCVVVFKMVSRLESYVGLFAIIGWSNFFQVDFIKNSKHVFFMIFFLFVIFFSIPFIRGKLDTSISELTGRESQYGYIPYYNVFLHPADANQRKDWNQ